MAMCLGWNTQSVCSARPPVDVSTGQPVQSVTDPNGQVQTPCPSTLWFWLSAAGIMLAGAMKGNRG